MLSSAAVSPLAKLRNAGAGRKLDPTKSPRTRAKLDKKNKRHEAPGVTVAALPQRAIGQSFLAQE